MLLSFATPSAAEPELEPDADLALVRRIAAGEVDAHRALYERHGRGVLAYLVCHVGDAATAEELLHDVMLAAWRTAGGFRGHCQVRTWLLVIAHHRAVNELRRRSRTDAVPSPEDVDAVRGERFAGRVGAGVDDRIDLDAAIERLPAGQREVLQLVFTHGLPQDEVAQVLGVTIGTVKSRLHRAKAQLRRYLTRGDGVSGNAVSGNAVSGNAVSGTRGDGAA